MKPFNNIRTIARFETKTLLRSWFFRIFAFIGVAILTIFNLAMLLDEGARWTMRAVSSSLPYTNLIIFNIAQSVIAAFLASDFLKRDKKLDTTEVIYIRSMSNGEYVLGKTLGIIIVFLILNILVVLISGTINLLMEGVTVSYMSYLLYPLLISMPTLIYILGLAFITMIILRNQAVSFVVLLGYIAVCLFYISGRYSYLFDYMAFSLPMIHSDLSGFADLPAILIQRGIYICLGLGLIFLSVQLINRLEQSRAMAAFSIVAAVVFLALASGLVIKHLQKRQAANNLRMAVKERYSAYADRPNVRVTACDIHLEHLGHEIKVVSTVSVKNSTDKALENLFFTLNPALKVGAVLVGDRELPFERDHQFVIIHEKTSPGDEVQLTITYQGRIDEKVAYPDVDDEQYNLHFRMNVYNVDRKYAFLTPDYVLLTREVLWYPSAWLPFDRKKAVLNAGQFTDFSLVVKSPHGLLPISQGKREVSDTDEFTFVTRQPLVQLSLVMGHYREESLTVDSIEYGLAVYEDHDYFRPFFTNLSDTLPHLITELKQDYERELGLEYPYDRFTLVEVPVQFVSHHRIWTEAKEVMQPQMSFFPEKGVGINTADFDFITNRIEQQNKQRGGDMTPTELEAQVFRQFVNGNLTMSSSEFFWGNNARRYYLNSYSIFPSYYSHTNYVYSEDWSFFNRALESYLWRKTARRNRRRFNADPQMNASQALQNKTFEEILAGGEIELINDVIDAKSEYLFKMIEIDIAEELDIDKLISTLVDSGRFRVSDMVLLKNTYQKLTGADLGPLLDKLLKTEELPGYLIADIRPLKFKEGDYTRYLVSFRITNTREVEGIVEATFYSGGGRGRGEGFRGSGFGQRSEEEGTSKLIRMGPGQTREVSVRLDSEPGAMALNTFISANLPGNVRYPLDHFEETSRPPAEVNRVTEHRVSLTLPNEIVVDNEDKGFSFDEVVNETPLRAWVTNLTSGEAAAEDEGYVEIRWWRAPNNWTPAISSWFYGGEVRSAHFISNGEGKKKATWTVEIKEGAYYDVYTYIDGRSNPSLRRNDNDIPDKYHYTVYHDDGSEEVVIELKNAANGWNNLGSFYLSPGEAQVEITDRADGRIVIADAIKWVKR